MIRNSVVVVLRIMVVVEEARAHSRTPYRREGVEEARAGKRERREGVEEARAGKRDRREGMESADVGARDPPRWCGGSGSRGGPPGDKADGDTVLGGVVVMVVMVVRAHPKRPTAEKVWQQQLPERAPTAGV
jgi:hypothetical protein